jgi:hypothetical protein
MESARPARGDLRASDAEREDALTLLREHHLDGRLTDLEFEERTEEVCRARFRSELWTAMRELPVPVRPAAPRFVQPPAAEKVASNALAFGVVACLLLVVSFGILFPLVLPFGAAAIVLGRRASGLGRSPRTARTAQVLGTVAVVGDLLALLLWSGFFGA